MRASTPWGAQSGHRSGAEEYASCLGCACSGDCCVRDVNRSRSPKPRLDRRCADHLRYRRRRAGYLLATRRFSACCPEPGQARHSHLFDRVTRLRLLVVKAESYRTRLREVTEADEPIDPARVGDWFGFLGEGMRAEIDATATAIQNCETWQRTCLARRLRITTPETVDSRRIRILTGTRNDGPHRGRGRKGN